MHRAAFVLALLLLPSAAAMLPPACAADPCVPFTSLERGISSYATTMQVAFTRVGVTYVIEDEETWRAFWSDHVSGRFPAPPPPQVDLSTHWIVAVIAERAHCCNGLRVTNIADAEAGVVLTYENVPMGLLHAFSKPYDIVAIARSDAAPGPVVAVGPPLAQM